MLFQELTSAQIKAAMDKEAVLLLPFGHTEQHGPHLPVGCDNIIADRVATATAARLQPEFPVLVLPTVSYGYDPKAIQNWPGVFRVRWQVIIDYLSDICTSAVEMGFRKIIMISTHGPHGDVARVAARDVFDRTGVGIVVSIPHALIGKAYAKIRKSKIGGTSHACEYETSLLMHFGYNIDLSGLDDRDNVQVCNEWVSGDMLNGSGRVSWSTWALQISETGVYGDPSCASKETGKATFDIMIEEYCKLVRYVRSQPMPQQTFPVYPRSW